MKRSRFTEQQIVGVLKQAESGVSVKELCRRSSQVRASARRETPVIASLESAIWRSSGLRPIDFPCWA